MSKELISFIAVVLACLSLTLYLGLSATAEAGTTRHLAQGVFSALFAVHTGVAWRALRQSRSGRRRNDC